MRLLVTALFSVIFLCLAPLVGAGKQVETAEAAKPQRVVLRVNRNTERFGFVALEDDDVIAIRNLQGEVESFSKTRVAEIIRLVDPQPNQTGITVMRDGQLREGVIIEDVFEHVLMEIPPGSGIRAKLKRGTVSHVVLQPTFEQRYAEYKAALRPGMYDAHLALCRWLFDQRQYELAQQELEELLDQAGPPNIPEARKLLNTVEAQLLLIRNQAPASKRSDPQGDAQSDESESTTRSDDSESSLPDPPNLISKADVNMIRIYEIDFDRPPKVTITPDTVRAIIERYGTEKLVPASQTGRNAMFRAAADQPLEIVRLMFDLRTRDLYPQIQVNSEPHALNLFRQRVHDTWLMNNCATSRCHGGPDAGRFALIRKNHKDERVRYTNFLILERLKLEPAASSAEQDVSARAWPLINYEFPEDSLIIQYGLSRDDPTCRKPHPRVPGWKPAFSQISPRMKLDAVEWIRSMMQPRPEYPVDFQPALADGNESSGDSVAR